MTSEKKMQIVIDNYFKSECNVDTSIRDAFEKGFRIGVQKASRPNGEWIEIPNSDFWECSVCGKPNYPTDYCPDCGARMKAR